VVQPLTTVQTLLVGRTQGRNTRYPFIQFFHHSLRLGTESFNNLVQSLNGHNCKVHTTTIFCSVVHRSIWSCQTLLPLSHASNIKPIMGQTLSRGEPTVPSDPTSSRNKLISKFRSKADLHNRGHREPAEPAPAVQGYTEDDLSQGKDTCNSEDLPRPTSSDIGYPAIPTSLPPVYRNAAGYFEPREETG